jgi:hypothetical protein
MVERSRALDRAEREALGERAVSPLEAGCSAAQSAIGIGAVLEDAQEDVVCRRAGGTYGRSPRSHAS